VTDGSRIPFKTKFVFGLKTTLNPLVEYLNIRIDAFIILAMLGVRFWELFPRHRRGGSCCGS